MSTSSSQYTSLAEIDAIYARINATWKARTTLPVTYRRRQLLQLARAMQENILTIEDALLADLGKQRLETTSGETGPVIGACLRAAEQLEDWMKPEKPKVEEWRSSWDTTVYSVPKGPSLLISPWNYPIVLTFTPLVGAIAAGCPVVMKPSECTPATSALIASLVAKYLDPAAYTVVLGAIEESKALLNLQWSHIFYTGGPYAGRIIAAAAAKFITPVTLELGGKSPVIIDPDYDLELAAKRVLFGKVQNSGQLCVSPDYVLVPRSAAGAFKDALKKVHASFFPVDPLSPDSKWSKIVNDVQFKRIKDLISRTKGTIITGGISDEQRRIAPTIVGDVKLDDALMESELFGPVLPIVEVDSLDEVIDIIGQRPCPLTIYAFTKNEELKNKLLEKTSSGSLVLNDTFFQLIVHEMPFGGVGESGYGAYYGKHSFDVFSHKRSHINVPAEVEPFYAHRYPPYTEEGYKVLTASAHVPIPDDY